MAGMATSETCGNNIDAALTSCPYCDRRRTPQYGSEKQAGYKVVNLEKGMPYVHEAVKRLQGEVQIAHATGVKMLVLIHGYGSSGEGGAIRDAIRKELQSGKKDHKVNEILLGEDCGKNSGQAKNMLRCFPQAKEYLQRANPGITIVRLS